MRIYISTFFAYSVFLINVVYYLTNSTCERIESVVISRRLLFRIKWFTQTINIQKIKKKHLNIK